MKSRQLGFVLMALIAVGVAGLIFRIFSAGTDEIILEGLVQVSREASDRVLIADAEKQTELVRLGDAEQATWFVDDQAVFQPILEQFWQAVDDLYDAQLVSINPTNHTPLGVIDGESIEVSFFIGGRSLQEKFLVGEWKSDVRLCYVRRAGHEETYGVPCPAGNIFDPDPDRWKNPVAASIPPNEILEIQYTYPDQVFILRPDDEGEWYAYGPDGSEDPIIPLALNSIIGTLQLVVASGFAEEEEADKLNFAVPDAMVRVITHEDASTPSTRLRFLWRDDLTSYLSIPTTGTVYIVDNQAVGGLLLRLEQMIEAQDGEGG